MPVPTLCQKTIWHLADRPSIGDWTPILLEMEYKVSFEFYNVVSHPLVVNMVTGWDAGVAEASEIYKTRMHNLCCDNCHSHVATALNLMQYGGSTNWNMVKLAVLMTWHARYVSFWGYLKTWLPFIIITLIIVLSLIFTGK